MKSTGDYQVTAQYSEQVTAQYSETRSGSDSSSYACEETRTPSNMGNEKPMELLVLPRGDEDSGVTIPAETVPDSTLAGDWKVTHTGSVEKLEDQFDKEVHIPMMKQPTTMKKKSIATPPQVTAMAHVSHPVDHNINFPTIYDVDNIDVSNNLTVPVMNDSIYHPASDGLDVKPPTIKKQQVVVLEDFNILVFNDEHNITVQ